MKKIKIYAERWDDLGIIRLRKKAKRQMQICRKYLDFLIGRKLYKGEQVTGYITFTESK